MKDCNPTPPSLPSCDPIPHVNTCCEPASTFVARSVCEVPVHIEDCTYDAAVASCDPCHCVPDFCADELAMTAEAKAAVMLMLSRLLQLVSPVPRCSPCGDPISTVGHTQPLTGTQKHNELGQPLYHDCDANGVPVETTSAVNAAGMPNAAVLDNFCCAPGLQHSPFLNSGISPLRHKGGNHPGYLGGVAGVHTSEFHEKMGKLFCCAYEGVAAAPLLVVEAPVEP